GVGWWGVGGERPGVARRVGMLAVALLVVAVAIGAWPLLRPPDGRLRILVLDVGQGDAIVMETPAGATVLIDAGSGGRMRLDAGERGVAPGLWDRGVPRLPAPGPPPHRPDHARGIRARPRRFA